MSYIEKSDYQDGKPDGGCQELGGAEGKGSIFKGTECHFCKMKNFWRLPNDGNVLNLACISVKILVVMLLLEFCKTLSLGRKWGTGTQ